VTGENQRARAQRGMPINITPLYVVCSPRRSIGKTLIARLLTEFYIVKNCRVAAVDLADEGPRLKDYLPKFATSAEIGDITGTMALFDRLIEEKDTATIIDVSHRTFTNFFTIVQKLQFFEEVRRLSMQPVVLFVIDPASAEVVKMVTRQLLDAYLVPVHNQAEQSTIVQPVFLPNTSLPPPSIDIPLLGLAARALIDQPSFSFAGFWWTVSGVLPQALDTQLRTWVDCVFSQFHHLECALTHEERSRQVRVQGLTRPNLTDHNRLIDVPKQALKCAPKQARHIDNRPDQFGNAIIAMVQKAAELSNNTWARTAANALNLSHQLQVTDERIKQLQVEVEHLQRRAVRAETWLKWLLRELGQRPYEQGTKERQVPWHAQW
jgi:hypothetical protein